MFPGPTPHSLEGGGGRRTERGAPELIIILGREEVYQVELLKIPKKELRERDTLSMFLIITHLQGSKRVCVTEMSFKLGTHKTQGVSGVKEDSSRGKTGPDKVQTPYFLGVLPRLSLV